MQGASTWLGGGLNFDSVAGERKVAQRKFRGWNGSGRAAEIVPRTEWKTRICLAQADSLISLKFSRDAKTKLN